MSQLEALDKQLKLIQKEKSRFLSEEAFLKYSQNKIGDFETRVNELVNSLKTIFSTYQSKLSTSVKLANDVEVSIKQIQDEPSIPNEEKTQIISDLRKGSLEADYNGYQINDTINKLNEFNRNVTAIKIYTDDIPEILEENNQNVTKLSNEVKDLENKIKDATERQDKIIEALDILRKRNIVDDLAKNLDSIDFKSATPSEVEIIKFAIKSYKNLFDSISHGINYAKLADARIKYSEKIETYSKQKSEVEKKKSTLEVTVTDINRLKAVEDYKNEILKIINGLNEALPPIQQEFNQYNENAVRDLEKITQLWSY